MRTKFIAGIAAAVITVSGLGMTAAYAKGSFDHMERKMDHLASKLNLSEEQTARLKEQMAEKKDGMQEHRQARRDIRQQLMQLDPAADDYQSKLDSLVLKAQEQAKAMIVSKAEQQQKLYDILTPEQEAQFVALKSEMQDKMEKRFGSDEHHERHSKRRCH